MGANFTTALLANNLPRKQNNAKKAEDCSAKNLPLSMFIKSWQPRVENLFGKND
jgi:hypothetical protein